MEAKKELNIKASNDDLKGFYSNVMQVVHTKDEFILDFFLASPPQGVLVSRVITSPAHLKRMLAALEDNVKKYEEKFGSIEETETSQPDFGFKAEQETK